MKRASNLLVAALILTTVGWVEAAPMALDHTARGYFRPYSRFENDRPQIQEPLHAPQTWPWGFYMRPAVTDPLTRGWQFAEPGFRNWTPEILGQIIGAGSVSNREVYVIYDMLAQELVPHLLYLDRGNLAMHQEPFREPDRLLLQTIGLVTSPESDQRFVTGPASFTPLVPPSPNPIPEPATAALVAAGLWLLLGRRPHRHR